MDWSHYLTQNFLILPYQKKLKVKKELKVTKQIRTQDVNISSTNEHMY